MIFVTGIHGVGKSFLCEKIKKKTGMPVYTASSMIDEEKKMEYNGYKRAKHLSENQEYLLRAIERKKNAKSEFILDGHFCLLNENSEIEKVDLKILERLKISGIILLLGDVEWVRKRMEVREKGKEILSCEQLYSLQESEEIYVRFISQYLHIPFIVIDIDTDEKKILDRCEDFLLNLTGKKAASSNAENRI